jgi:sulfatase maturation enzyme AslB (radical SAM superfamily)
MTPIEDETSLGNVKEQTLFEIMNSDTAKSMRKNMIEGKPLPKSCERCVSREKNGLASMRQGMNEKWFSHVNQQIQNTNEDGSIDELNLLYWDFRFSNYCNLSCRTCGPLFSTSWAKDYIKVFGEHKKQHCGLINLDEVDIFWDNIDKTIHTAKEIHFAGGEPLIMPEHWKLIEMLEERGLYDVELKYSTNATMLENKGRNIIDVWKKFKKVHLSLSIDGIGDTFEYVRNGGNWEKTKSNLEKIRDAEVEFWIHPTISNLNIFHVPEMHKTFFDMGLIPNHKKKFEEYKFNPNHYFTSRFHINPVFFPPYYNTQCMPNEMKKFAAEKLTEYGREMEDKHGIPFQGWQSLIDIMYENEQNERDWKDFIRITKDLDKTRNQKITDIRPEYKKYFE